MPQQPQDPRLLPDNEVSDPRLLPDTPSAPPNKWSLATIGESLKRGFFEGPPPVSEPGWNYPGAQRQDWIGDVSRFSMMPVGGAAELYNKLRGFGSVPNMGLLGLSAVAPATIPIAGGVFGAQMAVDMPNQAQGAYQQAQETGAFSPEAIGKYGELGLTGLMTAGSVYGGARHLANQVNPPPKSLVHFGISNKFDELPDYPKFQSDPSINPTVSESVIKGGPAAPSLTSGETSARVRPSINPGVADAVQGKLKPEPTGFEDISGPTGMEATLTTSEGIHTALSEGKIDQKTALKLLNKYYLDKEATPIESTMDTVDYPLTTQPKLGVQQPAGIQEVVDLMTTKQVKNIAELQRKIGLSYVKTKQLWEAAKEQQKLTRMPDGFYDRMTPENSKVLSDVPDLKGQTEMTGERVRDLMGVEPKEAVERGWVVKEESGRYRNIQNRPDLQTEGLTYIVKREHAGERGIIAKARAEGYTFIGLTDEGNFKFTKTKPSRYDENVSRSEEFGPKGNLFENSEGKGLDNRESFKNQWALAIEEAELLGIDYAKYDNIDSLQWDITRKTAMETKRTGRNPLKRLEDDISRSIERGKQWTSNDEPVIVKRNPTEPGESHIIFKDGRQYTIYKDASSGLGQWEVVGLESKAGVGVAFTKQEMIDLLYKLDESKLDIDKYSGFKSGKTIREILTPLRERLKSNITRSDENISRSEESITPYRRVKRIENELTPEERALVESYGPDTYEAEQALAAFRGDIETTSVEADTLTREIKQALNEDKIVYGPKAWDEVQDSLNEGWTYERKLSDGSFVLGRPDKSRESNVSRAMDPETGLFGMGVPKGGNRDLIEIFRNTIQGSTPHIAGKELLQNGIDATAGRPGGEVIINHNEKAKRLGVIDNGPGIPLGELQTVYIDLTSSGKRGGAVETIGELGVGKVGYLTKGEKFALETVVRESDGQLYKHSFIATPEEVMNNKIKFESEIVPKGTPTGTKTMLYLGPGESWWGLRGYLRDLQQHSKLNTNIRIQEGIVHPNTGLELITDEQIMKAKSGIVTPGRILGEGISPGAKFKVSVPDDHNIIESKEIKAILVSRGMFQGIESLHFERIARVPDRVVVEINPTVKGTHTDYPLTTPTRESMKWSTHTKVRELVQKTIYDEAARSREIELGKMFDQLIPKPGEKFALIDTQGKFTPEELKAITDSSTMTGIARGISKLANEIRTIAGIPGDISNTGFVLEKGLRGVNVRNPDIQTQFGVFLNPISILKSARNPVEAANSLVHIVMHEVTHMLERSEGQHYTAAFADVYTRFDLRKQLYAAKQFEKLLDIGGGYPIEVQNILRTGEVAFGRTGVEKNALFTEAGSNVSAGGRPKGIPGGIKPNGKGTIGSVTDGQVIVVKTGQATPPNIKRLYDEGFRFIGENDRGDLRFKKSAPTGQAPILESDVGTSRPTKRAVKELRIGQLGPIQDAAKSSAVAEAFNFPRGVMASTDLSAPLRQGLPLIHKKEFWKAMIPMFESWHTEEGFAASQNSIANRPLFKKRLDAEGKVLPSFADDAGLKLTDLTDLSNREEALMSTWAESGGMFNRNKWMAEHGGEQAASFYRATAGKMVRKSNRSYTAFLNNLRADVFENLIRDGKVFQADLTTNLPLARSIADFVNTATGRGSLGRFESSAVVLNTGLFAPRLIASRVKMLNVLNPHHFIYANPLVRKEALKSLFAIAAFGNTILQVAKMAGAEVGSDPNSSDFGKATIGNTRIDPWGGFAQYVVAANRLIRPGFAKVPGMEGGAQSGIVPFDLATGFMGTGGQGVTSSKTGKEFDLWKSRKGPYDPTHLSVGSQFLRNKTTPVLGFIWSIFNSFTEVTGQKMNFGTMNPMENAIAQRFIPILMQDIYQLAMEDPQLLPLSIPAAFGMGIQTYKQD